MTYIPQGLRRLVRERAGGACEYCLAPEATALFVHEVDHVIAEKHGGATDSENLALSCVACDLRKGSDIASIDPDTGEVTRLFHPRKQRWSEEFRLVGSTIVASSPVGRATVWLLQLNEPDRLAERAVLVAAGLLRPMA